LVYFLRKNVFWQFSKQNKRQKGTCHLKKRAIRGKRYAVMKVGWLNGRKVGLNFCPLPTQQKLRKHRPIYTPLTFKKCVHFFCFFVYAPDACLLTFNQICYGNFYKRPHTKIVKTSPSAHDSLKRGLWNFINSRLFLIKMWKKETAIESQKMQIIRNFAITLISLEKIRFLFF